MRTSTTIAAVGLALASFVSAQDTNQTGPFYLHIKGGSGNDSLDGYISACHTGAALEAWCYDAVPKANLTESYEFYFNYSTYASTYENSTVGVVSWHLPVQISPEQPFEEEQMVLQYLPTSNLGVPSLGPGDNTPGTPVGFDVHNSSKLFAWAPIEDSQNKPGAGGGGEPGSYAVFNWFVCWQQINSYYYQSVAFANSLPPSNPTCQAVEIFQEFPGSS